MENYTHDMIDELLVKYLVGEATPPEEEMVGQWVSASEENRHYFQHFQLIWKESRQLAAVTTVDENKAWQRFQRKVKRSGTGGRQSTGFGWWRIAASILIIAGMAWLVNFLSRTGNAAPAVVSIAAVNEVKKDTLPDGSVAILNKHAEISYSRVFRGKTRNVKLKGEAFFNVQPDKEKPFIIEVNDVQVKVIGTSFNIRTERGSTEVIVETGIVQVSKGERTIELKAGERIWLEAVDTLIKKEETNDKLYNYYVSRTFVCDNTPLWKLVEKLNEAYDADIRIGREELRKLPLTVTFDDESLDVILDIISQTFMIKVLRKENEIVLE